jgi:SAM-dependent methyltransferase
MADRWFATHAAGFGPLVLRLASRDFPGCDARADGDNALRLSSATAPRGLLAYCRGLFRVIAEAPGGLERASRSIARDLAGGPAVAKERRAPATFVLRSFGPDDPVSMPREARYSLEGLIARCTGARPDSERPGREYRLQERADGGTLFLERVAAEEEAAPRRGELPRSTCRLLAELTEPRSDDVFLDPFCGYGGIALERALAAPYRFVFASDVDPEKTAAVKASLSSRLLERRRKTIFPKTRDALDPSAFESGFVTAIATDPPWGLYGGGPGAEEAAELRRAFLAEAARLLAPEGRLVILTARGNETDPGPWFVERERLEVLVSGKKATAVRLDRLR